MAHTINVEKFDLTCPRCKSKNIRISTYHFMKTYVSECSNCALGNKTFGDDRGNVYG